MELGIEINKTSKPATVVFARDRDAGFLTAWKSSLADDTHPMRTDAVDLARLAVGRVAVHSAVLQPYANNVNDIGVYIRNNPKSEVACFVLLKCDWFPDSDVLGLCHFRRTWANNIIIDYLAAHPFIASKPDTYAHTVHGVGSALIYFLCNIIEQYKCGSLWGEATQLSNSFYQKVFGLDSVQDLIYVQRDKLITFSNWYKKTYIDTSSRDTSADQARNDLYSLEVQSPPFVGNKTAVFDPQRRLAIRFLTLDFQEQIAVATALGIYDAGDKDQEESELFQRFFTRAVAQSLLPRLWREVELRLPAGVADINPFESL